MQNSWSHLSLIFGLAAPLIMQSAALSFPNSTTPVARIANSTITKSPVHVDLLQTPAVEAVTYPTLVTIASASPSVNQSLGHGNFSHAAAAVLPTSTSSIILTTVPTATHSLGHDNFSHAAAAVLPTSTSSVILTTVPTATQSLSNGEPLQTAVMDSPISTTLVTMTSANLPTPQTIDDVESTFNPVPTTSAVLSVISNYTMPTPTPGSIAIINGIPIQILNNTIQQNDTIQRSDTIKQNPPILADMQSTEGADVMGGEQLYQPWNTSYGGPIRDGDWAKYLQIWDPVWWSTNLDSIRQTACQCSAADFYTNPQAQIGSYMNFQYYSHQLGALYTLDYGCGPVPSAMPIKDRIKSAKGRTEHCWQAAGGEFSHNRPREDMVGYWCDANGELCVEPWRARHRRFQFHNHERNYDRDGVHTYSETQPVVSEVCTPICEDLFRMRYDDFSHHNPNFITTFYPPKPVDLNIIDD